MGMLGMALEHPEDLVPLVKMKLAVDRVKRQIPPEPHWGFCYTMLQKVSRSFALVIQQLGPDLRNAVCIFYLVLRALDTVEDDTSVATDVKVPILESFYRYIYDRDWHFPSRLSIRWQTAGTVPFGSVGDSTKRSPFLQRMFRNHPQIPADPKNIYLFQTSRKVARVFLCLVRQSAVCKHLRDPSCTAL